MVRWDQHQNGQYVAGLRKNNRTGSKVFKMRKVEGASLDNDILKICV